MNNLPEDTIKIIVSLYPPKGIKIRNDLNIFHSPILAPDDETLKTYKKDKDWEKYTEKLITKITSDPEALALLEKVAYAVRHDKNVVFICYEKDYIHCHRHLLAQLMKRLYDIDFTEL